MSQVKIASIVGNLSIHIATPENRARRVARAILVVGLLALMGCAGVPAAGMVTSPFSARHGELFDDAADFLADPAAVDGAWAESWRADLKGRVADADVVAVIRVETLVSDIDPGQRKAVRLVPVASRTLKGSLPLQTGLRVSEGRPGYVSVDANRSQLMSGDYVLFLKWYKADNSTVAAHWHLAPASDPVMAHVERALGLRSETSSHIVIHHN